MDDQLRIGLADRYLLEGEIGRGGMATVYRAHDIRHDRAVAIKVLDPDVAATVGTVRFLREIRFGAGLQHPHILPVYDSGETAGLLWFTMPFIEGESLRARLRREKRLTCDQALPIACEAADALDFAHRRGVLHRDVKPDNILLSEGHALVADFGVGRAVDVALPGDPITGAGIVVGTPAYMAPEQAMGDPMDQRSDIYSLGIVVFEMLVGELPFVGSTTQMLEAKQVSGETPSIRRLRPVVPRAVERTVRRALAPAPDDRFQTGAQFGAAMREALLDPAGRRSFRVPALETGRRWIRAPFLWLAFVLLLGVGGLLGWQRFMGGEERTAPRRIAVLPFVNLNQADDEYFAHGISDDMRGKLAALPGLVVMARSSSDQYRLSTKRPQDVGRELGVDYLLTGTVRWEREQGGRSRVQVSPELVHAATGSVRWQQSFEAPLTDVFRVQGDIAERVAQSLGVALAVGQRERLAERPTGDFEAYDLFLRGRHAFHRWTAEGLDEARDLFERAIFRDPRFAEAYAGLAEVYVVLPFWVDVPPSETHPRAIAAAERALSLDSGLGGAHAALADARALYEWNWTAAGEGFRRALELDPDNANARQWYGSDYLVVVGRWDEAVREGRRARDLDPLARLYATTLAQTLSSIGRYDEALDLADDIMALDPDFSLLHETRGRVFLQTNRLPDAVAAFERNLELSGRKAMTLALLGHAYARADRRSEASRLLREVELAAETRYTSGTALAILHAGLGDTTEAFRWLEVAADERDPFLIYFFVVDPILSGLKRHPRGVALLNRMNLTPPR